MTIEKNRHPVYPELACGERGRTVEGIRILNFGYSDLLVPYQIFLGVIWCGV